MAIVTLALGIGANAAIFSVVRAVLLSPLSWHEPDRAVMIVAATLSAPRFTGMLLGVFAALAVVLSAIGIYGVLSYVVSGRTREIGIRVAIGAGRGQVLALVLRSGLGLALAGVAIGLGAAASLTRLVRTLLHDVTPADPATFVVVGLGLTTVALVSSLVPAWRATRVDPVQALKAE